ncbi:hypothetical protein N7491_000813 [Penicillium cf. griseofulvum]|uniref:Uncharacterized protein n=1 Tax=Penicillium cf. griseofulvum TaxID=2972120 RepID=A0A9W9IQJ1_9EURO|nr:hypothetical protein N7472_011220 [Penicillium cf. griseofulvum]KAJ5442975.1 hypothetical protein N7445_004726 [Penicillium cf. griseofulvum]KAJ5451631.1 hypothetical protein N7491_000813 [Penicillium cf. griseofulvum]
MAVTTTSMTSLEPTASYGYDDLFGSTTSSSTAVSTTGSKEYPVFPNGAYVSRFYLVSSQESGLTDLDIDLYNECFLPYNPLPHHNFRRGDATETISPKPTYLIDEAPCKRQAAINSNCYFQNTNGTFSGLEPYSGDWDVQQQCYCDIYPFFDSAAGCQECFRMHGGIEGGSSYIISCHDVIFAHQRAKFYLGYHWFPKSYVMGVSSAYCSANPQTTGFYPFADAWSKTSASNLPGSTAVDILGTQTAASLYYTYAAEITAAGGSGDTNGAAASTRLSLKKALIAALPLVLMLSQ